MGLVYDLFGNGKTALKYSLNRYNLSRTTGIAANYNPLLIADGDAAVDRQEPQRRRRGHAALRLRPAPTARSTSPACRRTSASRRSTSTANTRAPGISSRASKLSHELLDGLSVGGSWWQGQFPQPDQHGQPVVDDGRLHALHLVQPDHRPAVPRSTRAASRRPRARSATSTPTIRSASRSTTRTASTPSGAFPAAARSPAASPVERERPALVHRAGRSELRHRHGRRVQRRRRCATTSRSTFRGVRSSRCPAPGKSAAASTSACRSRTTRARPARA